MRSFTILFLGIIIGLAAGLLYGWFFQPVEYIDTSPDVLRQDYRADYILMVAESYSGDGDLELARIRLAALGPVPPANIVVDAIDYGLENNFSQAELEMLNRLVMDLRSSSTGSELDAP